MSYILDALRKADAERERGSVPGIHAQPLAAVLPHDAALRSGGFGGLADGSGRWLVGGAAAGLALVLALVLWRTTAPDAAAVSAAPPASIDRATGAAAEPSRAALLPPEPSAAQPAAMLAEAPVVARLPPIPAVPMRRAEPSTPPARSTGLAAVAPRLSIPAALPATPNGMAATAVRAPSMSAIATTSAATATAPTAAAEPAPPATVDGGRIYQLRELPDDVRRELPALTVGGATYSENAASRMLIINGQVFHENDKLAPELILERIQLRSAVLRFKGLRYAIAY